MKEDMTELLSYKRTCEASKLDALDSRVYNKHYMFDFEILEIKAKLIDEQALRYLVNI